MAFTSGSAANSAALIDAIRAFAVSDGWTNNLFADDGAGKRLHISKDGVFANLRTAVGENFSAIADLQQAANSNALWVNLSTGFNSGTAWYKQADAPFRHINPPSNVNPSYVYVGVNGLTGGVNYYLFSFASQFYIVIETPTGLFHWIGFGKIAKIGDWTGGEFLFAKHSTITSNNSAVNLPFFGSFYNGQGSPVGMIRVNGVDATNGWVNGDVTGGSGSGGNLRVEKAADGIQKMRMLWEVTPNIISHKPVLLPVNVTMTRNGASVTATTPFSILGYIPNIYFVNLSGLIPAANYSDGAGGNYRIFPFHRKVDEIAMSHPNFSSGTLGFAIPSD